MYGFLIGSLVTHGVQKSFLSGNIILFGQGIVTVLTVSMLYYSLRNHRNKGEYKKDLFKKRLFALRLVLDTVTIVSMLVFALALHGVIKIPTSKVAALIVATIATFFTGIAFLPQGIKVIKMRKTKSTSIYLSSLFAIGNSLLILALLVKIIDHNELLVSNIGGIILPVLSTSMMYVITFIKISNMIKLKEK